MNFLAHAYLSFNNPGVLVGNMISDFVKGNRKEDYEGEILAGILLHRSIDSYTDSHPYIQDIKLYFKKDYRLYAAPIVDVVLDYFVANDTDNFETQEDLFIFTSNVYAQLEKNREHLPEQFKNMLPYMISQNWLYNYRTETGIKNSLMGLHRRAKYMDSPDHAFEIFLHHRAEIENIYQPFFTLLKKHAKDNFTLFLNS